MIACDEVQPMLHALLDGELDAAHSEICERHLAGCDACESAYARLNALRDLLVPDSPRPRAPDRLRAAIEASLPPPASSAGRLARTGAWPAFGTGLATGLAIAASAAFLLITPGGVTDDYRTDQLVAEHVRSLLPGHLIDIQTSNQHVVKPWFNGRTDISPPVPDLKAEGFPLLGGRLDYLNGRVVPALVYGRHLHRINVFVLPAGTGGALVDRRAGGYSIRAWRDDALDFFAISDVSPQELDAFRALFRRRP